MKQSAGACESCARWMIFYDVIHMSMMTSVDRRRDDAVRHCLFG